MDSRLKGLSIESKNSHNGILTKEFCKLQAMKKISNLQHLQQHPLLLVIFGCSLNSIWYQYIYIGGFETQMDFYRDQEHPKRTSDEEVMAVQSLEDTTRKFGAQNQQGPTIFYPFRA